MTRIESDGAAERALARDYESLGERLARRGIEIDRIRDKAAAFGVAVPRISPTATSHASEMPRSSAWWPAVLGRPMPRMRCSRFARRPVPRPRHERRSCCRQPRPLHRHLQL